jgi:hypothetical protein
MKGIGVRGRGRGCKGRGLAFGNFLFKELLKLLQVDMNVVTPSPKKNKILAI